MKSKIENFEGSRGRRFQRSALVRGLVVLLTQAIVFQPAAFAAWNIAQQPLFTINAVYPNAVFMIDDSWSMNDYRLPPPTFFNSNNRWPAPGNVTVKYGATTRSVAAHNEFTLRSSVHNPLAYDPSITYTPWNDNDKPQAAQGTRPTRAQNYPPADIGGTGTTANTARMTERDMRFRGFANANPNAARNWISTSRGSVGGNGTYATGAIANDKWAWNGTNLRWEQPIANPAGTAIYPPLPGDGPQAADLFTNPPQVCTATPPCLQWNYTNTNQCVQTQPVQTGTTTVCDQYQTVPVFGNVCVQWQQVQTGVQNGTCNTWQQQQTGTTNGACLTWATVPVYVPQCQLVTVVDATSETGYRQVQQCIQVWDHDIQQCTSYQQIPVFTNVCTSYNQVPVFTNQCVQYQNQQTGTTQQCIASHQEPAYTNQCVQWQQVQTQTTCAVYDPAFVCPPQNITSDNLTPARYYRYEGPLPATDDDLATISHYRLVEVDRAVNASFPVPVEPRTGAIRTRVDCAAQTSCTRLEEMQNYANWFTYYRHRLFAAMAVSSQAAADLKGDLSAIRLGYGRINYFDNGPDPWNPYGARLNGASFPELDNDPQAPAHPGALVRGVRDFTDAPGNIARQQLFDWLFSLNWVGSTPNREALDSIGKYYLRASDYGPWSDNAGVGGGRSGDQHLSCRRSFAVLATDGEWTAIPENPPVPPAQPLITTRTPDPVGVGAGTVTASLATAGPLIQGDGLYQNVTYSYDPAVEVEYSTGNNGVTATLTDVALYYWNRDLRPGVPNAVQRRKLPNDLERADDSFWQNMSTFVVGYGLNASMDTSAVRQSIFENQQSPPVHNAVNWPLVDTSPALISGGERINDSMRAALASRGDFYSANDPEQMKGRIKGVFRAIAEQDFSGSGIGTTSAQLAVGSTLFRASFRTQVWTGSLAAYDAIAMATAAKNAQPEPNPLWGATFPAWNQRNIITSTALNTAIPFTSFNSLTAAQQADLTSASVMDYIRGSPVAGLRTRSTLLGSIVSSTPRYSKAPNFGYQLNPAAGGGSQYAGYRANSLAGRRAAVYVGANDGMFHAFDANPDPNQGGGQELFAYVPRSVYPVLEPYSRVEYSHLYSVDGPVVEGDVFLNNTWKTVVVGSAGAGPAGLFALDVTAPDQFDQSKVLWDLTPAEEPDLGKVMGYSYVGSVKYGQNGGKWVAIVPNGYASANDRAVLLIIDMATGQTLKKIDTCQKNDGSPFPTGAQNGRCDPGSRNGLANVSVIFDANRNVVGALSGDYQGNLWKFDLSSSNSSNWKVETEDPADQSGNTPVPLFTAVNGANQAQPITAAPRAATHPFGGIYVVFGTGKFFEYSDQSSTDLQSIYGLWIKPGDKAPILKSDVQAMGLSESTQNGFTTRALTGTAGFSWRAKRGWSVDLVAANQSPAGERVIADPVVERGVLTLTSFQPTTVGNPCEGGGTSYFYAIPMDASLGGVDATRINGVVSSILPLIEEEPLQGQRSTTLSKNEIDNAMMNPNILRKDDGTHSVANRTLECVKLYNQTNVQTGYVPKDCAWTYPLRTWRPIR